MTVVFYIYIMMLVAVAGVFDGSSEKQKFFVRVEFLRGATRYPHTRDFAIDSTSFGSQVPLRGSAGDLCTG